MGNGRVRTERAAWFRYALDSLTGGIDAAGRGARKHELGIVARGVT